MQNYYRTFILLSIGVFLGTANAAPPSVISPQEKTVASLTTAIKTSYELALQPGGGVIIRQNGQEYHIESSYSFPHGGHNRLLVSSPGREGESGWKVKSEKLDNKNYRLKAAGKYYTVERFIEVQSSRVMIKDTFHNISEDVLGIIIDNYIQARGSKTIKPEEQNKFTAFVRCDNGGVGIIAMDDLYQCQMEHRFADGRASLYDKHFGLAPDASYTIQWAIYPTASGDYYDFINQIRKDEGINRRVDGSFSFVDRREPPDKKTIDLYNLAYTSLECLGKPPDDQSVGLEGFEFTEYPQECRLIKKTLAETKRMHPHLKVMFHVAHGLYACCDPEERFPDSRVIRADGKQIMYGGNNPKYYAKYFSQEKVDLGWRWYIFYPTLENSFGKAMIEATRYMIDELGATGMWADGFISGYSSVDGNSGGFSYDRWDGHSVDIDPKTKLVVRKKTCVPWVSLPVLKKVVRMIAAADGVTITNEGPDFPSPRSLWNEEVIASCEGSKDSLPALHLGRAPCSLSSAAADAQASYRDILAKLEYGSLYFMYVHKMDHKTLLEHMFPITIESIHAGTVRGIDRIVTKNSGIYGWPRDRALHIVYRYDSRGYPAENDFLGTTDATGVRTELQLAKDESAALLKIPVEITSNQAVNFHVDTYDADGITLSLNGHGVVRFSIKAGAFAIEPDVKYIVVSNNSQQVVTATKIGLEFSLAIDGPTTLQIKRH